MARTLLNLMCIGVAITIVTAFSCDGDLAPIDAESTGADGVSFNNVNGFCQTKPASCDDLRSAEEDLELQCCFENLKYSCSAGELVYAECFGGCDYNAVTDDMHCGEKSEGSNGNGSNSSGPYTDPGPGF